VLINIKVAPLIKLSLFHNEQLLMAKLALLFHDDLPRMNLFSLVDYQQ
jgi:hypothetical protein